MDAHSQAIFDEFLTYRPSFEKMKDVVLDVLYRTLKEHKLYVTAVEARVKAPDSLQGKLDLKGYKYNELYDITDILGARIVTFYGNDVDKVAALVERLFTIDWDNSVDKRKLLEIDQFGYMSLHYICQIPESLYHDPEHPEINHYKFELQMRTALQHVWATAHHDTGYKSDVEIPREYIRGLNRLASVLEIADEQFNTILQDLEEYRRRVKSLIKGGSFDDLALDGDTFRSYLEIRPFDKLNTKIASIDRAEIQETSFMPYLGILRHMGLKTIGDIERMKEQYSDAAYQLAVNQLAGKELDILAGTIGLQNLCILYILAHRGGEAGLRDFYDRLNGQSKRNASTAKRTYDRVMELALIKEEPENE